MISTVDRLCLAALTGMPGSSHSGERDNASQLPDQFRQQRGFNRADLLASRPLADAGPVQAGPRMYQAASGWGRDPICALPLWSWGETAWR
ncbi:MAG: hypothetical protein ACJ8AW_31540 [Rhodopila sp.]